MDTYDDNHWDWIRDLINKAEARQPQPATPANTQRATRAADAIETSGDNVYAVTRHDDGLVSYQPLQGNWR